MNHQTMSKICIKLTNYLFHFLFIFHNYMYYFYKYLCKNSISSYNSKLFLFTINKLNNTIIHFLNFQFIYYTNVNFVLLKNLLLEIFIYIHF